jgi:ABC-2 type transport system ATP-binding protein
MSVKVSPLQVENLSKSYGQVQALNGVSFEVKPGEVFGLLGPNGAGKTSLISIIVTLEKASGGRVLAFGSDVSAERADIKNKIGWVPQEIIHHGYFSVVEILRFHAGYYGVRKPDGKIEELLHSLDLTDHRNKKVRQLSGGMKRRLMIAKALVHDPELLLLDEPTAGVDVELRQKLWAFVKEQKNKGMSILLTTHYLEEAEHLCDRVAIINKGSLQAIDSTRDLISQWSRRQVVLRLNRDLTGPKHPDVVSGEGKVWTFMTDMKKPLGILLNELNVQASEIVDVQMHEGSLEDVFVHFTRRTTV